MSKKKRKDEEYMDEVLSPVTYWQEMWISDKRSMVETMLRNIAADIAAGYNPVGDCIKRQRDELRKYEQEFDSQLMALSDMAAEDPMPDAEMTVEEARESDHPALYMELEAWDYADDGRLILYYDSKEE